jgi:uncharacterized membrane protein (GlpM family)
MVLALGASWALARVRPLSSRSPLVVFGQTSLFVYFVHVELVYGVFSYPIRHRLPLVSSLGAYALFAALLFWGAWLWQRRPKGTLIPPHMASRHPVSGDGRSSV